MSANVRGNLRGSAVVGGFAHFVRRFGAVAAHEVVARLPSSMRPYVTPNAPNIGLLGTRDYPYPVVGEILRAMHAVSRMNEDEFIREIASNALDSTMTTVHRFALRWLVSPKSLAVRAQETWDLFNDSGRLQVHLEEREYRSEVFDWPNHDATVCRLVMEGRRRLIERTGVRAPELFRDKCKAWGDAVCASRIRWT